MTIDTKSHLEAMTLEPVHGLHCTVALMTSEVFSYVPLMIEQYVLRYVVHLLPRGGGLVVEIPVLLLDPGMFGNDVLVTVQTLFNRWQPRVIGVSYIGVTVEALDLLHSNMQLMAEGYGLFRTDVCGIPIEEIEKQYDPKNCKEGEEQGNPVSFQGQQETIM